MPNITLYVNQLAEQQLAKHRRELSLLLREATAKTLPGNMSPDDVALRFEAHIYADNATTMQILTTASHSVEREEKLLEWAIALAEAWQEFATEQGITWKDDVDVWTTMPPGKWMLATEKAIRQAKKAL